MVLRGSWFDEDCVALRRFVSQGEITLHVGDWMSCCRHGCDGQGMLASRLADNMRKGEDGMTTHAGEVVVEDIASMRRFPFRGLGEEGCMYWWSM